MSDSTRPQTDANLFAENVRTIDGTTVLIMADVRTMNGCVVRLGYFHPIIRRAIVDPWMMTEVDFQIIDGAYHRGTGVHLERPPSLAMIDWIRAIVEGVRDTRPPSVN